MFKNKPEEVFLHRIPGFNQSDVYLALAIPRELPLLYSDLSFRNNINATVNNTDANTALDRLINENSLDSLLSEASIDTAIKGGVVFKNYLDNGKSKITYIQPDFYFPEFSKFDKRKIVKETIAYTFDDGKGEFLYREIYEPDANSQYWCITKINNWYNGRIGKQISSEEINIKLTESPLTYIPYFRSGGEFWGYSIYDGLEPLFDELNHRCSQISKILDKHSDPNMYGDPSFLDEKNNIASGGKFFPVETGEEKPGYLTWKSELESNFKFIEEVLFKILYMVSPLKPSLYGLDKVGSGTSGRVQKLKAFRTECMVERSLLYWKQSLKKILYLSQQLEIISGNQKYKPEIPNIEIYVSLPRDSYEQAQEEQLKTVSGLTSVKSAIARINPHYTSAEVENEFLEIINEENEKSLQMFLGDRGGVGE
ncbi:phage portal protein [Candidatus Contubernalis alkalaceticus]|nr:phage portal protein [Candidatus Contubernalis alkalaceticus]UNC92720.1 phage portal protein [Candidatus Contubernalis alkalaceticus]